MAMIPAFLAPEVKANRRAAMPKVSNRKRMMVSEVDIAAVIAKVLTEPAEEHVGREYVLTNSERVDFSDIARMLGDELGMDIEYADDDGPLRKLMGQGFDQLMNYLRTEGPVYEGVTHSECIVELLGRPQVTVREYIRTNRGLFL
jgi:uncharacterized protein YbjT (DUF2867 family)